MSQNGNRVYIARCDAVSKVTDPGIESLFAAVCLHVVDDGSMERTGSAHLRSAVQYPLPGRGRY